MALDLPILPAPSSGGIQGPPGESIVGPVGARGEKGEVGSQGPIGLTGSTGPKGNPGTPADPAVTNALAARIAALEAQKLQIEFRDGVAVPNTVVVLGTATVDVTVTWPTPFPDTNYTVTTPQVVTTASILIGKATAALKSKTAASIVVTVTTTATIAVNAATISVLAYRRGP